MLVWSKVFCDTRVSAFPLSSAQPPPPPLADKPPRRHLRRVAIPLLALSVLAASLSITVNAAAMPSAAADHIESEKNRQKKDHTPQFFTPSRWKKGTGGRSGSGFWYVTAPNFNAVWNFGDLRGVYRPGFYLPNKVTWGRDAKPLATGTAYYRIQQNQGSGWETVYQWSQDQGELIRREKNDNFWWRKNAEIELSGRVRVLVRMSSRSGVVVVDSFKLDWIDLHSHDKFAAIQACKIDVIDEVGKIEQIKSVSKVVLEFAKDLAVDAAITSALAAFGGPVAIAYKVISETRKLKRYQFVHKSTGNLIDLAEAYNRLKDRYYQNFPRLIGEALGQSQDAKDLVEAGANLGLELLEAIETSLSADSRRRVSFYTGVCEKRDGVSVWDDPWDWIIRTGYLEYVQDWHPAPQSTESTPSQPDPEPTPPVSSPTPQPQAKELRISWGSDASGRSDCPQGQRCLYLDYQYIGNWGSPPYTLECWGNGRKSWEGQWSGRATRGCIAWAGTTHVVVDGIRSNTLTHSNS